jgi:hypothetical protein
MTNFYDKECKKEIKCFYDPCYRTGDYYTKHYVYDWYDIQSKGSQEDSLLGIVSRAYNDPTYIWFVTGSGETVRFKYLQTVTFSSVSYKIHYILFESYEGKIHIFDSSGRNTYYTSRHSGHLNWEQIPNNEIDLKLSKLVQYSFVENFMEKDNIINPECYNNVKPWSDEEREIVRIRSTTDPYYKSSDYK